MTSPSTRASGTRPISVADIAAQSDGIRALHRRIDELRSTGMNFAADAITKEMLALGISPDQP